MHFKPKYFRFVLLDGFLGDEGGVDLEKDVLEGSTEVGAVDDGVPGGFRVVEVFAFGAVEFDGLDVGKVGHAGWEEEVGVAHDAGAFAKVAFFVLVELEASKD